MNESIILLAHGSPEKYAKRVLLAIRKKFSKYCNKKKTKIYHAFLQFNKPNLEDCLNRIKKSKIVILPVLISHGWHTKQDLPKTIKTMKKRYRGLSVKVALPLQADDLMVKLLFKRYKEVRGKR